MSGNTYVFMYYLHTFGKHTRVSMLLLANEEATHARSFVFWSILLDILTRFQMQLVSSLHTRAAIVFSREHCVSDMFCKAVIVIGCIRKTRPIGHETLFQLSKRSKLLAIKKNCKIWNPAMSLSARQRLLVLPCFQGFSASLGQKNGYH